MSKSYHRQCKLEKKEPNINIVTTSWIPEEFAILGKYLRLNDDDGWKVIFIGDRKLSQNINERSRDFLKQRSCSDI
jgi:hypothetical protein